MNLRVGYCYKLKVNLCGRIEEYKGRVLSAIKDEFRFETEDDNTCRALTLRNSEVVYCREIECKKEDKTYKISNKKRFTNLKPSIHPEF